VHLVDFGIVALMDAPPDDLTAASTMVGTLRYAAPERLAGGVVSPRSDVWALGAVLYEMLTGQPAVLGDDPAGALAASRAAPAGLDALPPALATVVSRAMATDPVDRYPDAIALRDALTVSGAEAIPIAPTDPDAAADPDAATTVVPLVPLVASPADLHVAAAGSASSVDRQPGRRPVRLVALGVGTLFAVTAAFAIAGAGPFDGAVGGTGAAEASNAPTAGPTPSATPVPTPDAGSGGAKGKGNGKGKGKGGGD
jgi:serine/threonine-protein kinase